jgi:GntR family transcriptional regulator
MTTSRPLPNSPKLELRTLSLAEQVFEHLQSQIESGVYPPGSQLPTENELQEAYGVSRTTIRDAISQLQAAHLVRREQGRGTFVRAPVLSESLQRITSFADEVRRQGKIPSSRLISCEALIPPKHVAGRLALGPDQPVTIVERVRLADDHPVSLSRDYIPVHIAPGLCDETPVEIEGSLYRVLEEKYQIRLLRAEEEVEAVVPRGEERKLLEMPIHDPALFIRRTTLGSLPSARERMMPVHYVETLYRADRFRYVTSLVGR